MVLFDEDRATIKTLGRTAASLFRVHDILQQRPMITIQAATKELALSVPRVGKSLDHLIELGIVVETTGKRRNRLFAHCRYLFELDQRTEPLPQT